MMFHSSAFSKPLLALTFSLLLAVHVQSQEDFHPERNSNLNFEAIPEKKSEWSQCSRDCGPGVQSRIQLCEDSFEELGEGHVLCRLSSREYKEYRVCQIKECSPGELDYKDIQCSRFDNKTIAGLKTTKWIFSFGGLNPCELRCKSLDHGTTFSFGKMAAGTRCSPSGRDVCINGRCVAVGCDGVVGSQEVVDQCGQCGGDNLTCRHYRLVFRGQPVYVTSEDPWRDQPPKAARFVYEEVAEIPRGAANILVSDTSTNYIALQEGKRHIINGDRGVDRPGDYRLSGHGILASYHRDGTEETIRIKGPIVIPLRISVLLKDWNPGIHYEYWISQAALDENRALQDSPTNQSKEEEEAGLDSYRDPYEYYRLKYSAWLPANDTKSRTPDTPAGLETSSEEPTPTAHHHDDHSSNSYIVGDPLTTSESYTLPSESHSPVEPTTLSSSSLTSPYGSSSQVDHLPVTTPTSPAPSSHGYASDAATEFSNERPFFEMEESNQPLTSTSSPTPPLGPSTTERRLEETTLSWREEKAKKYKYQRRGNPKYENEVLPSVPRVCPPCKKVKDQGRHFCKSDFVLKVRVLQTEIVSNRLRLEMHVLRSYKNVSPLFAREYVWLPDICKCPRLREGKEYIIMAHAEAASSGASADANTSSARTQHVETSLALARNSFVRRATPRFEKRILNFRLQQRKRCKKYQKTSSSREDNE